MSNQLFREGGPYNIRRIGQDRYAMSVDLPIDAMGMTSRASAAG